MSSPLPSGSPLVSNEHLREEVWIRDGRIQYVPVRPSGPIGAHVDITYELLSQMLIELGWTKADEGRA